MASGGEGSRNLNKGKGPLQDLLEHQGDDVSYNDRLYHEFLQSQFGSDLPRSPNPPLIISDEPDPNLYDPDSNENLSTPQPPSNEFVAGEEEKPMKSDLFKLHMKKIQLDDGMIQIKCNYCSKIYRTNKSFGYGTYWNHIRKNHPSELVKTSNQSQISRYGTPTNQLFHYTYEKNKEELAVMVAVEHLPFSFGEKVGFVNYCQNALNPAMQRVPRSTLTRTMFSIYKKQKNKLKSFFYQFEGRVSVCADIWTDNFGRHHYMGVTCHYMDNDWVMQKRIIAFRVFDDSHTAQNIFRLLKIIFEEFHIQNKIFAIGFDNAASNTASIPMLQDLCNPYFGECLQDYLTHYYKSLDLEVDVLSYCNSIKALLYELYDEYLKIYGPSLNMPVSQHQPTSDSTGTSSTFKLKGLGDRLFFQRAKKLRTSSSSSSGSISELDRYLETSHEFLEDSEFSIQVWWKDHEHIFPILAIIAKQILGTPVSTVAVEQEFSAGGNILEPRRSVMCPQKLEAQACLDDWTKAKYRQQEIEAEIVNDFFEDDQTTGTEGSDYIPFQLPTFNTEHLIKGQRGTVSSCPTFGTTLVWDNTGQGGTKIRKNCPTSNHETTCPMA
ncbi:hypothetical protein Dsin_017793 [Dipteronia sinensis]|uniref:HAT C-terminal dimerisation domain-containing protein n=1 Tax=Dipteronia sinensis TaxID=43782 RepID=A0AAE0AGX5_9ROSI|nr:hypothetical protein Dsin_017793 [Dipteronia sinensis]